MPTQIGLSKATSSKLYGNCAGKHWRTLPFRRSGTQLGLSVARSGAGNGFYDSLDKIFLAYFKGVGLKTPPVYKKSNVDTWAETIGGLALVRHLLVHGEETVPKELEDFCAKPHALDFKFIAGTPLRISFWHLQAFDSFIDQLITAINLAFLLHPDARK